MDRRDLFTRAPHYPSAPGAIGDLVKRMDALDAKAAQDMDGFIRFDFDNQGGWLDITTNNSDGDGLGIKLRDESGGGIAITAEGGAIGILLESDNSRVEINDSMGGITIVGDSASSNRIKLDAGTNVVELNSGLKVYDSDDTLIFEVRSDGSVHIPTGTSVIADL